MEKLSLEKFKDNEIEKEKLAFITAGSLCTGGGSRVLWDEVNYVKLYEMNYQSDSVNDLGETTYYQVETINWYNLRKAGIVD